MRLFFHKLIHWEYWPYQVVFIPVFLFWPLFAIRARSLFFFNAVNPTMRNGGFIMNSKKEIYDLIPQRYYPSTVLIDHQADLGTLRQKIREKGIEFPVYAKPDIGLRGLWVEKIFNEHMLADYHKRSNHTYLVQEASPFTREAGIFYVRIPGEETGKITGIVYKEFLKVTGDGSLSLLQLLTNNKRYAFQITALAKEFGEALERVPAKGEQWVVPYGNHCRGALFLDAADKITPELTKAIDDVAKQIDGYYYGRMDVLFHSWESLEKGEHFHIVELNGAISEPTHMYDPKHSIWFAWKELVKHFYLMSTIARLNSKSGVSHLPVGKGVKELKLHFKHLNRLGA